MNPALLRKVILGVSVGWAVIAAILALTFFMGWLPREIFDWVFIGGFILYAVVITFLSKALQEMSDDEVPPADDQVEKPSTDPK
ncbi:hypothetical protein SCOR_34450 [Sulfidibacter corallicola]|uniref:Uncharacterized protein n=1 Tax=Sulfidibacter corallicola TaxID=2818388 RepID=A0A8A4TJN8_SULCO|nr:hypothetical protein [Sulfidibacter corallicola]QTD49362.1 hypothetical protein J3U87_27575 [Sulfidibacter corallicola]